MTTLGFLPKVLHDDAHDYELAQTFWALVDGENKDGVSIVNLFYLLEVMRGFKTPEREQDVAAGEGREGISAFTLINSDGELIIRKNGQRRIM